MPSRKKLMQQNNKNILHFNKLIAIVSEGNNPHFTQNEEIEFETNDQTAFERMLNEIKVEAELISPNIVRVKAYNLNYKCYSSTNHFLNNINIDDFNRDISIIDFDNSNFQYFDYFNNEIYINKELTENYYLFSNTKIYLEFFEFLKTQRVSGFIDYFNEAFREIILTSPNKDGRLVIGYKNNVPDFNNNLCIEQKINRFYKSFDTKELPKFIKNEIFTYLDYEEQENRLNILIDKLDSILDSAERNFDVYLTGFSFDDLKVGYFSKRESFLEQIRNVLNKVSMQVVALPLSISAVVFASYSVDNSTFTLILILCSFSVFTFYLFYLLNFYSTDLEDLNKIISSEFERLQNDSFFRKHPEELKHINKDHIMISNKIKRLNFSIIILFILVLSFNLLFTLHIINQIIISIYFKILVIIIYLSLSFIFFFLIGKND